jgi:hypothetical protein
MIMRSPNPLAAVDVHISVKLGFRHSGGNFTDFEAVADSGMEGF